MQMPKNNKSAIHWLYDQMEKLDQGKTTLEKIKAHISASNAAVKRMKFEIKRAEVLIQIERHKKVFPDSKIELRETDANDTDTEI